MALKRRSHCPIAFALEIFGDKWSLLILRDLIFKDQSYYEDFLKAGEGIATNILADRLLRLKSEGLIVAQANPENRRRILYRPTEKALDLIPMLLEIIEWSAKYDSKTAAPKEFVRMLKRDRKTLAEQVRAKFKR